MASGGGSSARAIIEAARAGLLDAEPRLLVSNRKEAPALAMAAALGVPTQVIATVSDPTAADARLAEALDAHGVDLVVLSGYLRQLGPRTLARYRGRILNIHPGPLPRFGGHGMYGRRVHEAVLASGEAASAVSIHVVDEEYDHGPLIAQKPIPVEPGDDVEALEARVRAAEPPFFVECLQRLAAGDLRLPSS